MKMNIDNTRRMTLEYYNNSIRTSGEVLGEIVRDKEVICLLTKFIGAKVQLFLIHKPKK